MAFNCSHFCHIGSKTGTGSDSQTFVAPEEFPVPPSPLNPSPPGSAVSRRKTFWSNFKSRTRKLRSRSADGDSPNSGSNPRRETKGGGEGDQRQGPPASASPTTRHRPDHQSPGNASETGHFTSDLDDLDTVYEFPVMSSLDQSKDNKIQRSLRNGSTPAVETFRGNAQPPAQYAFYMIDIILREGRDLVIKDSCGTSDPYVKFKVGNRQFYRSRTVLKNLNPKWEERFTIPIDDLSKVVKVKVYDYDRGLNDDRMGFATIDAAQFQLNVPTEMKLLLSDDKKKTGGQYMGYLVLQCTLIPKSHDDMEQYFRYATGPRTAVPGTKKPKTQLWSAVINVVLIEGRNLIPMDDNGLSDPYLKFRLGNERYKSKYKVKTLNPKWLEQFDLYLFEDQTSHLEIFVYDHDVGGRDDIMGRTEIDLVALEPEKTHELEQVLEDGAGVIHLLVTISGTYGFQSPTDLASHKFSYKDREQIVRRYGLLNSLKNISDVGWLMVKVFRAQGLSAADIGGKSDPFCVLELINCRLQTQTEYKTLAPDWQKVFIFCVSDIHSVLELTIYDEDRDKKSEFLGKVSIPLLWIKNRERKWFPLKDKKLSQSVKGTIELEMDLIYNDIKAVLRTLTPREERFLQPEPRFKVSVMKNNIERVSDLIYAFVRLRDFIESCFNWKVKLRSFLTFGVFVVVVWNFELYMFPITLFIILLKNIIVIQLNGGNSKNTDEYIGVEDDDDDDDKDAKEEKKVQSFREKLQSIQDVCLQVQESMDMIASLGERIKNSFMWHVPWLSVLAMVLLCLAVLVLYYVPLRCLLLIWGVFRFTRTIREGDVEPNNELVDYLSRVPSDRQLSEFREISCRSESPASAKKKH